ncbi:MAG TPA: YitT family protein [Chitinophagaceae bacterium]|nr:YitT family protein [Chitinophagaceae bacterium]
MNHLWSQIIVNTVYRKKAKEESLSPFELAKGMREFRLIVWRQVKDSLLIITGVFCAGFGLKSFLLPASFIDGGATGISLMIAELTSLSLPVLLIVVNFPFILLALVVIDRGFAFKASLAIIALALCTAFFPFPDVTHDKLLVAVFGGFFLGAGIGLSVRGGAVLDGTEVLAIFISRKSSLTIGDVILVFNIGIFLVAAWLLSVETALYSVLTYLSAAKTVDFIIEGIEEYTGVTIISVKSDAIRKMITDEMGRGVTVYRGKRGFGKSGDNYDVDIVYTVITRLEVSRLNAAIERLDPHAFVVRSSVKDTKGGMIKKRRLH